MKNKLMLISIALGLAIFASCKKENICYTCTCRMEKTSICERDYKTTDDFYTAKDLLELAGYSCKNKCNPL